MELLIPGLILVALMVYASTRIKKTAAAAFEPETVETGDFVIQKSEGFLHVLNGDPQYLFEAYSKGYGESGAASFRQGTAYLRSYEGSVDSAARNVVNADDETVSDLSEVVGEHRYRIIEVRRVEKDVDFKVFYKLAEKDARVYEFKITAIAETTDEFMRNIESMLDSFEIK